jgi:diguanylate cyclase (GGDEF)-like protein
MLDPLTGVGNRRFGESVLAGWFEQHERFQRRFGVLFADLDHFKLITDRFGAGVGVGEEALIVVARTFQDNLTCGDHVIHWGGEEFVILVADTNTTLLTATAERFRMLVTRTRLPTDRHHLSLSISIAGRSS